MKKATVISLALLFTSMAFGQVPWINPVWSSRARIAGLSPTNGSLRDFPVLVRLSNFSALGSAATDASDITFAGVDGFQYFHEIESFNAAQGYLNAWVCIPSFTNNTEFFMYWSNNTGSMIFMGSNSTTTMSNTFGTLRTNALSTNVWDTNFAVVMHFSETSPTFFKDSSRRGNHASYQGLAGQVVSTNGLFGPGARFNNNTMDNSGVRIDSISNTLGGATAFTVSTWVKILKDPTNQNWDRNIILWSMRGNNSDMASNGLLLNCFPGGNAGASLNFSNNQQSNWEVVGGAPALQTKYYTGSNTWYKFCTVSEPTTGTQYSYFNGALSNFRNGSTFVNNGTTYVQGPLYIAGHSSGGSKNCFGIYDEFRLSTTTRSSNWIATEYAFESSNYLSPVDAAENYVAQPFLYGSYSIATLTLLGPTGSPVSGAYCLISPATNVLGNAVKNSDGAGNVYVVGIKNSLLSFDVRPLGTSGLAWLTSNVSLPATNISLLFSLSGLSSAATNSLLTNLSSSANPPIFLPALSSTLRLSVPQLPSNALVNTTISASPLAGGRKSVLWSGTVTSAAPGIEIEGSLIQRTMGAGIYILEYRSVAAGQDESKAIVTRRLLFYAR